MNSCEDGTEQGKLAMKMQPYIFNEVVNNLSDLQKKLVVKTGFGEILSLNFRSYPIFWGYNLVKYFEPKKYCLKVGSGGNLHY